MEPAVICKLVMHFETEGIGLFASLNFEGFVAIPDNFLLIILKGRYNVGTYLNVYILS